MKKYVAKVLAGLMSCLAWNLSYADKLSTYNDYCLKAGGTVEEMPPEYSTYSGNVQGDTKRFCTFNIDNGFIVVSLATFASDKPSIAATFIKKLPEIPSASPLFKGEFSNPSLNFCKNLGGSSIGFVTSGGGFSNEKGQSDVCVFGDGSMVSGWSLIYIANHRTGYELIREKTKSQPLGIKIPGN